MSYSSSSSFIFCFELKIKQLPDAYSNSYDFKLSLKPKEEVLISYSSFYYSHFCFFSRWFLFLDTFTFDTQSLFFIYFSLKHFIILLLFSDDSLSVSNSSTLQASLQLSIKDFFTFFSYFNWDLYHLSIFPFSLKYSSFVILFPSNF